MADERVEKVGDFEMLWDCPSCGTKGLLGKSQRHCPECGAVQDPDKRYFPKEGEEKKVDGHVYEGADRVCGSCQAPMGARAKNCANCGAPMGDNQEVRGVSTAPKPAPKKSYRRIIFIVLAVVLLGGILIWYRCVRKIDATLAVTAHTWTTSIAIEEWSDVHKKAWRNEVPGSALASATCSRAQHGTKQVPDGETCRDDRVDNKDGTFKVVKKCTPKTKSEPVYDEECRWTELEWHKVDEAKASGSGTTLGWSTSIPPPYKDLANIAVGTRKAGAKSQKLNLVFGTQACDDIAEASWRKYKDGDKVKLEIRASSGDIVCSDL